MKMETLRRMLAMLLLVAGLAGHAQAATIRGAYTDLGNQHWTFAFSLANDSQPEGIQQFTLYFPRLAFADLAVLSLPAGWDGLIAQPDAALDSDGFFDSFNPQPLALGQAQGGFAVGFTYAGPGAPGALAFDIVGADFQPVDSGVTEELPEPSSWLLLAGAALMLGLARRARKGGAA